MNLKEQLYVCTLARTQSLSRAAEELFISQPALSVYITNLEKYLGVPLFERTERRFYLTCAGESYVKKAEEMLMMKADFEHDLEQIKNQYKGRVRIGFQLRRGPDLIPRVVARFKSEYPWVEVILKEGAYAELEALIDNHQLDLVLSTGAYDHKGLEYQLIYEEQILLALPDSHFACALAQPIEGSQYQRIPLAVLKEDTFFLQRRSQSIRRAAERIMQIEKIIPRRVTEIRNMETAMQMVACGLGVCFNWEGYISGMRYLENVRYFSVGETPYVTPFVLAWPKDRIFPPYMDRMREILVEEANNVKKNLLID